MKLSLKNLLHKKNKEEEKSREEDAEDELTISPENEEENDWIHDDFEEGQLSVDVYETPKDIIIKSTIAGVKPEDIDISINNDMLTIKGKREEEQEIKEENYLYKECYWGSFSRSIILPTEIHANKIDAQLENGILTVTLPKVKTKKDVKIKVKEK